MCSNEAAKRRSNYLFHLQLGPSRLFAAIAAIAAIAAAVFQREGTEAARLARAILNRSGDFSRVLVCKSL